MGEKGRKPPKVYAESYKAEAVKLARRIGVNQTVVELGVPKGTLYGWVRAAEEGGIDLGAAAQTPQSAQTLANEIQRLRAENKALEKKIREVERMNEFLEEASAFFAASRQKLAKKND
jgi:transposase